MEPIRPTPAAPEIVLVAPSSLDLSALTETLAAHGFRPQQLDRPQAMLVRLAVRPPQALLLAGDEALAALRALRQRSCVPALVLAPCGAADTRVAALEDGADDVLSMPVLPREMLARLRAVLRRTGGPTRSAPPLRFGPWRLDCASRELHAASGRRIALSPAEFRLLRAFVEHPGSVLGRDALMDLARGRAIDAFERSIDLLVSRLRAKLDDDPRAPRYISTVRGAGYRFDPSGAGGAPTGPRPGMLLPGYQGDTIA